MLRHSSGTPPSQTRPCLRYSEYDGSIALWLERTGRSRWCAASGRSGAACQEAWTSACVPCPSPAPLNRAPALERPSDSARVGPLAGQKAAVNDQFGAGDKRRFVGGQKQHAIGHFQGLPNAAERRQPHLLLTRGRIGVG